MTALTVTSQTHAAVTTLAYDQQGRLTHQQVQAAGDPAATTIDSVSSLDFTGASAGLLGISSKAGVVAKEARQMAPSQHLPTISSDG
jgi:YD repeat-containing protein